MFFLLEQPVFKSYSTCDSLSFLFLLELLLPPRPLFCLPRHMLAVEDAQLLAGLNVPACAVLNGQSVLVDAAIKVRGPRMIEQTADAQRQQHPAAASSGVNVVLEHGVAEVILVLVFRNQNGVRPFDDGRPWNIDKGEDASADSLSGVMDGADFNSTSNLTKDG